MIQQPSSKYPTITPTTCSLINQNHTTIENHNKILVIGACALDRLLHVPFYPKEDGKILCHETFEYGGGNAANTASGLGKLSSSSSSSLLFQVQLLSKIGSDDINRRLCHELVNYGVDLSSPLFIIGETGTTSPIATVIVTTPINNKLNDEASVQPTRTCFFDKGTCGVLESSDVINHFQNITDTVTDTVPATNITIVDKFFTNVRIIHSDSRHTDAALIIAKEAKRRNIPISLDLERDRFTKSFDELIDLASIVFTSCSRSDNSYMQGDTCIQLKSFIDRKKRETEVLNDSHSGHSFSTFVTKEDIQMKDEEQRQRFEYYIDIISMFHSMIKLTNNEGLEMIITRGHLGALQCKMINSTTYVNTANTDNSTMSLPTKSNVIHINASDDNGILNIKQSIQSYTKHDNDCMVSSNQEIEYEIHVVGPPILQQRIVDTTGAGDAFIAGYLWSKMVLLNSRCDKEIIDFDLAMFSLRMASWVAGKKIQGPGARATLPTLEEVQNELGIGLDAVSVALECKVNKISF